VKWTIQGYWADRKRVVLHPIDWDATIVQGPSDGGLGGQDALDGFPPSGRNAYTSGANAFFAHVLSGNAINSQHWKQRALADVTTYFIPAYPTTSPPYSSPCIIAPHLNCIPAQACRPSLIYTQPGGSGNERSQSHSDN